MQESVSDRELIRAANHACLILRVLACIAALVLVGALVFSCLWGSKMPAMWFVPAMVLCVTAGYWMLSVAAKRGNPNAPLVMVYMIGFLIVVSIAVMIIASSMSTENVKVQVSNPTGFVLPALLAFVFYRNYQAMREVERRGLGASAFGPPQENRRPCLAGASFLLVGIVGLFGMILYLQQAVVQNKEAEAQAANAFVGTVQAEEAEFLDALSQIPEGFPEQDVDAALAKLSALDGKMAKLQASLPSDKSGSVADLAQVLAEYRQGLQHYRRSVEMMKQHPLDAEAHAREMQLGERLRLGAIDKYNKRLASP